MVIGGMVMTGRMLSGAAGFTSAAEQMPSGPPLKKSGWGSAKVNGLGIKGFVQLVEYADGWLLRHTPLFGGGAIWLPRATTEVGKITASWLPPLDSRMLVSGNNEVRLSGHLAHFVAEPPAAAGPAAESGTHTTA